MSVHSTLQSVAGTVHLQTVYTLVSSWSDELPLNAGY